MKIKESGSGDKILWLFVAVGAAIFLAGAALGIVFIVQSAEYDETTAVITRIEEYRDSDGERARDVFVRYTYGGVEYEDIELSWWESGMREGDEITVLCRRDDPSVTRSETLVVVLPLILLGFGALFGGLPLIPLVGHIRKTRGRRAAKKRGVPVQCVITDVSPDYSYRVNGRLVNNIAECRPVGGNTAVAYDSAPFSRRYPVLAGSAVTVYVLPDDPSVYWVDLGSAVPPVDPVAALTRTAAENNANTERDLRAADSADGTPGDMRSPFPEGYSRDPLADALAAMNESKSCGRADDSAKPDGDNADGQDGGVKSGNAANGSADGGAGAANGDNRK